ncbi:2-oxo acid dehydrogenase subunit E2 [Arthrobacter glacialis]|uniref:2-oxo acid dehydrogenase subunit E2 n=1 Tax=Arthrobacter glacialis TaxID=1664 RepID=UPI00105730B1
MQNLSLPIGERLLRRPANDRIRPWTVQFRGTRPHTSEGWIWGGDSPINLGIPVDSPTGLAVPVISDAQSKDIDGIATDG